MTNKDLIVDFVALHGKKGARYTDIIKFIYEHNNPGMTYDRSNRGYYSSAFSRWTYDGKDRRYLLKGDTCLVKLGELYFAKRDGKILHTHRTKFELSPNQITNLQNRNLVYQNGKKVIWEN